MSRRNRKRKTRIQRKAEWRQWLHLWLVAPLRVFILASFGVGLGFAAYKVAVYLYTSPALAVRRIEVHGNERASMRDLLSAAGLREGSNIFEVDTQRARRRLLEHPWVRAAKVKRVVPDRIVVEIEEHIPAALVELGGLYLVDPQGIVFKRLLPVERFDLPLVTGIDRRGYNADPAGSRERIVGALDLIHLIEKTDCLQGRSLAELHVDELLGPTIVLDPGGISVRLGSRSPAARLPLLCRLLREIESRSMHAHVILLDRSTRLDRASVLLDAPRASEKNEG
ncbi:MAG: FtsQ-type POTRA domain-containing protein [Deltaproteobacteria bacterium]|nr:FtsQ-type POTRA domain-containing protein [Deltaproteobacteria bacterium]